MPRCSEESTTHVSHVEKYSAEVERSASVRPLLLIWSAVTMLFFAGLLCRVAALEVRPATSLAPLSASRWRIPGPLPFLENDENIYIALVEQLDRGKGYTLQGHPILRQSWINHEQYDQPLFFHPPGGLALFWLMHRIWPSAGFAVVQVVSYGIFYWSMVAFAGLIFRPSVQLATVLTGVLAAFSPIMTHVVGRFWLDGPLLAFTTLAAVVFLYGMARSSTAFICVAGVLLGYASLIKATAFLVLPGLAAITPVFVLASRDRNSLAERRRAAWHFILFLLVAFTVQLPWEIWQWAMFGTPFPYWAGKPAADLVLGNAYVYYLTIWRQPWVYLELLPQVLWTLVPSLLLLGLQWTNRDLRLKALGLLTWIGTVVGTHIVLGFLGYSKLLRYVILITPASVMLFVLVTLGVIEGIWRNQPLAGGRRIAIAAVVLAATGMVFEITQGVVTPLYHNVDIIKPLPGFRSVDYGQRMPWPPP